MPVRVLSRVFRGKYLERLRQLHGAGKLVWPAPLAGLTDAAAFAAWLTPLCHKDWVVYAKPPFGGPEQVLKYLARYTHRVAISNARLLKLEAGKVTFRYKDYAEDHRQKTLTLSAEEFLRRFVQHVLPRGFVKIRHYGLLANRHRKEKLTLCRRLLLPLAAQPVPTEAKADAVIEPALAQHCPRCGGCRFIRIELPREAEAALPAADTS